MTAPAAYPVARFPANPITPQGAYYFLNGIHPRIVLRSHDGTAAFEIMGGGALADRFKHPECVQLAGAPKGLIAPWKLLDHQGANEDGVTFIDSANEPLEIDLPLRFKARDGIRLRHLVNMFVASFDSSRTSQLSVWTPDQGYWQTQVRWFKPPPEGFKIGGQQRSMDYTLRLRGDLGFWQGLDDVNEFRFAYDEMADDFEIDYTEQKNLGPNWPILYLGRGGGYVFAGKGQARWRDDPNRRIGTEGRTFIAGPYRDFATETDYQVIEFQLGNMLEFGAADDGWARMGRRADGSWNGYGTRARVTGGMLQLSAFNNFHETPIKSWGIFPPPLPGEWIRVEAGDPEANDGEGDPRAFRVKRGLVKANITAFKARDDAGIAPLGVQFRGAGFGGYAAGAWITQGTPAALLRIRAGDANITTQSGVIERLNIGTIPRRDRYTLYGPGTFEIAAGPGSSEMVKFGPLLPNQIVRLNSNSNKPFVSDLTKEPPTAAELLEYREAMAELESYAPIGNIGPTVESNASAFGVVPPQGNLNRLREGWFNRPLPAKPAAGPAKVQTIAVSISGGNSDSRIIAHGTPLRRYPQ